MANFIKHEPCPNCHSEDNLARYDDGSGFCFGCKYIENQEGKVVIKTLKSYVDLVTGEFKSLDKRNISEKTCKFYDYRCGLFNNQIVHSNFVFNINEVDKLEYVRVSKEEYSENINFKAGVSLSTSTKFSVTINGNHTCSFAGTVVVENIILLSHLKCIHPLPTAYSIGGYVILSRILTECAGIVKCEFVSCAGRYPRERFARD